LTVGTEENTSDGSPASFRLENGGNIFMNISINATALFTAVTHPSRNYQFRVNESSLETGSFSTLSNTSYLNMPAVNTSYHVVELNWRNINDEAEIDINITVPTDEPSGSKSSTVTFSASGSSVS
ncbi:MAG: hypothetical protein Q8R37_01785, partial [Nanoarchaeota archaeon]|nr:hypothetical protein [Nanoarchaeota archaeon]